jgi:hypothetical protein
MERRAREKRKIAAICVYVRDEISCGDGMVGRGKEIQTYLELSAGDCNSSTCLAFSHFGVQEYIHMSEPYK